MSQYGEPLRYVRDIDGPKLFGHASDGECLFAEICDGDVDTDVLMARAVACVNALNGKNPDALARFVFQAKMALEVLESGPENLRVSARALRKAMEYFGT